MHATLVTLGSRGDFEPYLALGNGLREAGYRVRLATHRRYAAETEGAGLEFSPLAGDPRQLVEEEAGHRWLESGRNPVRTMGRLLDLAGGLFQQLLADCEAALTGTQAVLFSVLGFPAYHLAEAAGIPAVAAYLQPMTRTRAFPSVFVKSVGPGLLNLWSHMAVEQITWQPLRRKVNRWRLAMDLEPLPISGLHRPLYRSLPVLYGYSPLVVPRPDDWPSQVKVTGYWHRPTSEDWQPPERLARFLEEGPTPIYLGFGSIPDRRPEALAATVQGAVRTLGKRAVVMTGWGALDSIDTGEDVLVLDHVPHDWLFPRTDVVVHHGGAGTTGTALRAGVPTVAVPVFADQFFWAERTVALGTGKCVPRRRLTAEALVRAISSASDPAIRRSAAALGSRMRAEKGVEGAVAELGALLSA